MSEAVIGPGTAQSPSQSLKEAACAAFDMIPPESQDKEAPQNLTISEPVILDESIVPTDTKMVIDLIDTVAVDPKAENFLQPVELQPTDVIDLTMDDDDDPVLLTAESFEHNPVYVKQEPNETCTPSTVPDPALDSVLGERLNTENLSAEGAEQFEMLRDFVYNQQAEEMGRFGVSDDFMDADIADIAIDVQDSGDEHVKATDAFRKRKRQYDAKKRAGRATTEDHIDFQKARNAEDERLSLRASRHAFRDAHDQESLFMPEQPATPSDEEDQDLDFSRSGLPNYMSEGNEASNTAATLGFDINENELESGPKKRGRRDKAPTRGRKQAGPAKSKATKDGIQKPRGGGTGRGGNRGCVRGRKIRRGLNLTDTDALFKHNIIEDAIANQNLEPQTKFTSTVRKGVLNELIASMPEDQRDVYHGDKVDIDKALSSFTGRGLIRSDGKGGWKLKGMKTSLHNYQVIGTAFLRDREKKKTKPHGGLLGDIMGMGKSCMMIANLVDGGVVESNQPKTTLIIVPPALMTQWLCEVDKHASPDALKDVIVYRSGSRVMATDPVRALSKNDVVITSYNEVRKSMPKNEPPLHIVRDEDKLKWWYKHFEESKGVLHHVKWARIVLDEAQHIKNHESLTFLAVDHLIGKYRWAISGTPVQNSVTEFYSFFRFLRYPNTGSFELFKKNYCKPGSLAALTRLQVTLSKIMVRRTHSDKLFGKPILQLPPIKPLATIVVEFNSIERAIYQIVRNRFVDKLKCIGRVEKTMDKSYRNILALLTRLRQLVSSPLLIQKTLRQLLESEDLERLWQLTENPAIANTTDGSAETANALQLALGTLNNAPDPSSSSRPSSSSLDLDDLPAPPIARGQLAQEFRKYLKSLQNDGQWAKVNERSLCHACGNLPERPQITSCMHIYCFACINELKYEAASDDKDDATCRACGARIKKSEACPTLAFDAAEQGTPVPVLETATRRRSSKKDEDEGIDWFNIGGHVLQSAKTKGAVKKMEEWWAADTAAKIIIFVQFRGMIKIFERICRERGWRHASFHGEMTFDTRDEAIKNFNTDAGTKVLIAAMKCGGTGLNLTGGNRCLLIDLWFNQCVETQAFCRVFRIGQTRNVEVARLVVNDTIDMDILKMQERKTMEIENAMEEKNRPMRLSTRELLKLFGPAKEGEGEVDGENDGTEEPFIMADEPYADGDGDFDMRGA